MIIHIDADAFFASVEQAADTRLRGKAIAVGGAKRGIIASASYEARKMGVYTPMPTAKALKLCPKLIVIPGDYERYEQFSRMLFNHVRDYTPLVELGGIDEGYADVSGNRKLHPVQIADRVRRAVRDTLKIGISEGIASNKLVSQIASKLKKPNGFIDVPLGTERIFLEHLEASWLPGIGPANAKILQSAGIRHIGQLAILPPDEISLLMGSAAHSLHQMAQGIDTRPVVTERDDAKSYGHQETFGVDVTDEDFLRAKLRSFADRLFTKVRADGKTARTLTVTLRYNDMDQEARSESLDEPTNYEGDVYFLLDRLVKKTWSRRVSVRLIGLRLSNIYDALFESDLDLGTLTVGKKQQIAAVVDAVRSRFGPQALLRGHDVWLKAQNDTPRSSVPDEERPQKPKKQIIHRPTAGWTLLNCKSHFSFMDSLLSPAAVVDMAVAKGIKAAAITDPNLHGAVEFFLAAKEAGIKPVIAAEVTTKGDGRFNAYVESQAGYTNLCTILSEESPLALSSLKERSGGLILVPAEEIGIVGPDVRYGDPGHQYVHQIMSSIRTLTLLKEGHPEKRKGSHHLRPLTTPQASLTEEIIERSNFAFESGHLRFPRYHPRDGSTAKDFLWRLAMEGGRRRYRERFEQMRPQLELELSIISEVGYEDYFLLTWDLLEACKAQSIQWITRGSAADSMVCYALGISDACPIRFQLYFQRFLNRDRMALRKLPDIDLDFPHDRKDEVVEILLAKYGKDHAAIVGGFNTFQGRSALAEIAKVLGVSEFQIRRLTTQVPMTSATDVKAAAELAHECRDLVLTDDPYKTALALADKLDGVPRYPKMHPCGVVLSRDPIHTLTPTFMSAKGWQTTHFDMDAVETVGLVKLDILAQGGLAVMRDTLEILSQRGVTIDLPALEPWQDPEIWKMIGAGKARGVHHIESPAMTSLERMCDVNNIDDLIAVVSVIRPGAANSTKKATFARRCQGLEPIDWTHPSLEKCLASTYGVVAYEEHILQILEAFAGIPPGRGDLLRRALVKQKMAQVEAFAPEFVAAATRMGRDAESCQKVWALLTGFSGYAFCRAHSTAYGIEAYQAAHLKRYHPAEFMACVLDNGKGFYGKLVYALECGLLGIPLLRPDINAPHDCFWPEPTGGIRVPLNQVKGLRQATLERHWLERTRGPFHSLADFVNRVSPEAAEVENLVRVGAFDSFSAGRTDLFWAWRRLAQWRHDKGQGMLFSNGEDRKAPQAHLQEPSPLVKLKDEMELLDFTVSGHPLELHDDIDWQSYCPISDLGRFHGETVLVAGLTIDKRSHMQGNGRQMKFISICDRSGIIECEVFADTYQRFGLEIARHPVLELEAKVAAFDNGKGYTLSVMRISSPRSLLGQ